jgi:hypothetical protein
MWRGDFTSDMIFASYRRGKSAYIERDPKEEGSDNKNKCWEV